MKSTLKFTGRMLLRGLGQKFAKRLIKNYRGDSKSTFSRYLTLSRFLNLFYDLLFYTYNIFSGGDNLFMIGPWKEVLRFICAES